MFGCRQPLSRLAAMAQAMAQSMAQSMAQAMAQAERSRDPARVQSSSADRRLFSGIRDRLALTLGRRPDPAGGLG
ncbi:hypothetical protein [Stieleria mannarensis]|uniref:hypothetical protein n=1 Tax=Stieleria mannarensis TaxID=2755585 RepID=UPI001600D0DE|nr:hypothetical protein [Rhodopirellula sp. JC639]